MICLAQLSFLLEMFVSFVSGASVFVSQTTVDIFHGTEYCGNIITSLAAHSAHCMASFLLPDCGEANGRVMFVFLLLLLYII